VRIVWSPLAIERASEAAKYIARDKPAASRAWLEGVFEAVDRLEAFRNPRLKRHHFNDLREPKNEGPKLSAPFCHNY